MYPSDYGYAVLASSCARTTVLGDYGNTACAGNNWLKTGSYEWMITPSSSSSYKVFFVNASGYFYDNGSFNPNPTYYDHGVRPSIYLKSNIAIMGGNGSRDFPYIVE